MTKYRVEWQDGSGWYYPDGSFLDVTDEVRAKMTVKQINTIVAACAKHHQRVLVADVRNILIVVGVIVAAAALFAWLY